jgi:hypothetical protein
VRRWWGSVGDTPGGSWEATRENPTGPTLPDTTTLTLPVAPMVITELPDSLADLVPDHQYTDDGTTFVPNVGRTPGLHVSGVIGHIMRTLSPARYGRKVEQMTADEFQRFQARIRLGLIFEDVLGDALARRASTSDPDRYQRPGEFTRPVSGTGTGKRLKQLIGTPDLLDMTDLCVEEWKATKISTSQITPPAYWSPKDHGVFDPFDNPRIWPWLAQGKTYLCMTGFNILRIRVLFINGNYKWGTDGSDWTFKCWQISYSDSELAQHWHMIETHARQLLKAA